MKYLLAVFLFSARPFGVLADEVAAKEVEAMVETLLGATERNDLEAFRSVCDNTMQAAMTSNVLASVHTQMSGLMKAGYTRTYMGVLNRGAFKTYYWKVSFSRDVRNEVLAHCIQVAAFGHVGDGDDRAGLCAMHVQRPHGHPEASAGRIGITFLNSHT